MLDFGPDPLNSAQKFIEPNHTGEMRRGRHLGGGRHRAAALSEIAAVQQVLRGASMCAAKHAVESGQPLRDAYRNRSRGYSMYSRFEKSVFNRMPAAAGRPFITCPCSCRHARSSDSSCSRCRPHALPPPLLKVYFCLRAPLLLHSPLHFVTFCTAL